MLYLSWSFKNSSLSYCYFVSFSRLFRYYFLKSFSHSVIFTQFYSLPCLLPSNCNSTLIYTRLVFQSCHFQMAGLASIFHSKFIQEILVSDWIIRSAHAQTGGLQMRSPLSKWQDLALYCLFLRAFHMTKHTNFTILSRLLKLWIWKWTSVETHCDLYRISGSC